MSRRISEKPTNVVKILFEVVKSAVWLTYVYSSVRRILLLGRFLSGSGHRPVTAWPLTLPTKS